MLKARYLAFIPLLLLLGCSSGGGQGSAKKGDVEAAREAVNALQSVDSAVSIGTNMMNYGQLLVPAKTEVDQYLATDSNSELAKSLDSAVSGHRLAFDWWQCNIAEPANSLETYTAKSKCRDALLPNLFTLYPDIQEKVEAAVADREKGLGKTIEYKSDGINPEAILQLVWQKTTADTQKAASLVQK